jgi:hypothetical protein
MMLSGEGVALQIGVLPERFKGTLFFHFQGCPSKIIMKIKAENTRHHG